MNFLDNFVLPQSAEHLELLKYLIGIALMILVPYLSLLIGLTSISAGFYKKGISNSDDESILISKLVIDSISFNKSMIFGFGLIPLFSISFAVIELMNLSGVLINIYFVVSLVSFMIGIVFVYSFKHSLSLHSITTFYIKNIKDNNSNTFNTAEEYDNKTTLINKKYPYYGISFLVISVYFLITGFTVVFNTGVWETGNLFWSSLFSFSPLFYFINFLTLAYLICIIFTLYKIKLSNNNLSEKFIQKNNTVLLKWGIIIAVIFMITIITNLIALPVSSLSLSYFSSLVFLFLFTIIIVNQLYLMLKNNDAKHTNSVLYLIIIVVVFFVVGNISALSTSTQKQIDKLSTNYITYQDEFKKSLGIETKVISGADIYNGKCIACHAFDKIVVGPPYNVVLKKYEGNMDKLVKYILNPVKVDPNFPSMPNQGVKPNEAKAVAEYIISTYKK
ncbi:MAG: cytochrome c [bacterium]